MLYFFTSSRKADRLHHPITVSTSDERKAYALAVFNFKKHNLKGTPKRIEL